MRSGFKRPTAPSRAWMPVRCAPSAPARPTRSDVSVQQQRRARALGEQRQQLDAADQFGFAARLEPQQHRGDIRRSERGLERAREGRRILDPRRHQIKARGRALAFRLRFRCHGAPMLAQSGGSLAGQSCSAGYLAGHLRSAQSRTAYQNRLQGRQVLCHDDQAKRDHPEAEDRQKADDPGEDQHNPERKPDPTRIRPPKPVDSRAAQFGSLRWKRSRCSSRSCS